MPVSICCQTLSDRRSFNGRRGCRSPRLCCSPADDVEVVAGAHVGAERVYQVVGGVNEDVLPAGVAPADIEVDDAGMAGQDHSAWNGNPLRWRPTHVRIGGDTDDGIRRHVGDAHERRMDILHAIHRLRLRRLHWCYKA